MVGRRRPGRSENKAAQPSCAGAWAELGKNVTATIQTALPITLHIYLLSTKRKQVFGQNYWLFINSNLVKHLN